MSGILSLNVFLFPEMFLISFTNCKCRALQVLNTWANTYVENFVIEEDGAVRKAFIKWVDELKLLRENEKKDKKKKSKWKLIDLEPLIATVEIVVCVS